MTNSAALSRPVQPNVAALHWLALSLTTAVSPIRGHRLVRHFGGVDRVFRGSLTELEAAEIKVQLEVGWQVESTKPAEASLFADLQLSPRQQRIYALLQPDEATQLDEIAERLKGEVSSSEIFPLCSN